MTDILSSAFKFILFSFCLSVVLSLFDIAIFSLIIVLINLTAWYIFTLDVISLNKKEQYIFLYRRRFPSFMFQKPNREDKIYFEKKDLQPITTFRKQRLLFSTFLFLIWPGSQLLFISFEKKTSYFLLFSLCTLWIIDLILIKRYQDKFNVPKKYQELLNRLYSHQGNYTFEHQKMMILIFLILGCLFFIVFLHVDGLEYLKLI